LSPTLFDVNLMAQALLVSRLGKLLACILRMFMRVKTALQ
jgi:hypothetical protein